MADCSWRGFFSAGIFPFLADRVFVLHSVKIADANFNR